MRFLRVLTVALVVCGIFLAASGSSGRPVSAAPDPSCTTLLNEARQQLKNRKFDRARLTAVVECIRGMQSSAPPVSAASATQASAGPVRPQATTPFLSVRGTRQPIIIDTACYLPTPPPVCSNPFGPEESFCTDLFWEGTTNTGTWSGIPYVFGSFTSSGTAGFWVGPFALTGSISGSLGGLLTMTLGNGVLSFGGC